MHQQGAGREAGLQDRASAWRLQGIRLLHRASLAASEAWSSSHYAAELAQIRGDPGEPAPDRELRLLRQPGHQPPLAVMILGPVFSLFIRLDPSFDVVEDAKAT
jgi:hypothetical protein